MKIVPWTPALAQDQADLSNRSDPGWPSTITHGLPYTAAAVRTQEARARSLGVWLAYEGRRAVGYVRLTEMWGDSEAAYVSFLNVDPAARGKGVGKALIFRCLQECLAWGYPRLDLHTWPGNDRAMRLYKRTGFHWTPETAVYMQNYLPQILLFPPAKEFFARNDWYRSYRRKVTYEEDDLKEAKAKVFPYRFTGRGGPLTVWCDPRSKGITGFETPEVRVFGRLRGPLVAGSSQQFLIEVRNRGKAAIRVDVQPRSSGGFTISAPRTRNLPPGKSAVITATLDAPLDLWPKTEDEKPHRVETRLRIGGTECTLSTAVEVSRPLSAAVIGSPILVPGTEREITLLITAGPEGYRGPVEVAGDGVAVDPARVSLRLGKSKEKAVAVKLTPVGPASRFSMLRIHGAKGVLETVRVPMLHRGDTVVILDRTGPRFRSEAASAHIALHGGGLSLNDAHGDTVVDWAHFRVGPGLWPGELNALDWTAEVDERLGVARLRTVPPKRPWLEVTMEVRLRHDVLELGLTLANRSRQTQVLPLSFVAFPQRRREVSFATRSGVRHLPVIEWEVPSGRDDVPETSLTEGWLHVAGDRPLAVLWDRSGFDRVDLIWWTIPALLGEVTVPAGGRVTLPPVSLAVGCPTWEAARALWSQRQSRATKPISARPVRSITAHPRAVLATAKSSFTVRFENARSTRESGTFSLSLPSGFQPRSLERKVSRVDLTHPWEHEVRLRSVPATPGLHTAIAAFRGNQREWSTEIPVLVPRGRITATAGKRARVDAGGVRWDVAGDFGAIVSLKWRGREYLATSYPEETAWSYFRPWCGGVAPSWNETLEHKGLFGRNRLRIRSGAGWASVGLTPKKKPKGLECEVEYTGFAGLPAIALSYRLKNPGRERRRVQLGFSAHPKGFEGPGELRYGGTLGTVLRSGTVTSVQERCGPIVASVRGRQVLGLVAGPGGNTEAVDMGIEGRFISASFDVPVEPKESRCLTAYLVAARSIEDAWAFRSLQVCTVDDLLSRS